jgi:hypothetical protein
VDRLKYEFIVKPGADPARIKLAYSGASKVSVKDSGALAVATPVVGFEDGVPYAYQVIDGEQKQVAMHYMLEQTGEDAFSYGFILGDYDRTQPLILDPDMLVYCGYIGGANREGQGHTRIVVDSQGNAFVSGTTCSDESSFPVKVGPDLTYNGYGDAFVAKVMHYPPSLTADVDTISESTGGTINFTLDAGMNNANRNYIMLGSTSGTWP